MESERCLHCGGPLEPAPCTTACPTHIDIPRFVREIKDGAPIEAAATIFASNALGGSCARVCPTEELCEGACVLHKEGRRPVEIGRLQRFATDHALGRLKGHAKASMPEADKGSVAVIGAGPAGLSCAEELACLGYKVTVYEKRDMPGGLVTHAIAPYKQQIDPMLAEAKRILELGIEIRYGTEVGKEPTLERLMRDHDALFLGAGMGEDVNAGLDGEDLAGVYPSLELIEAIKLSDPNLLDLGNRVAVIGGGNTAIDVVRELIRLDVREVTLIYRRDEASMPAFKHEIRAAKDEGVRFEFMAAPKRLVGSNSHLSAIECLRMEPGEPDAKGRPRPVPVAGSEFQIEVDSVVTAIGQSPIQWLYDQLGVKTEKGLVQVDETFHTNVPKVFAGGDCITGGTTVVESVRHGKLAARGIDALISKAEFKLPEPVKQAATRKVQDGPLTRRLQGRFYIGTAIALCKGCNLCVNSCPPGVLFLDEKSKIQMTDISKCVFCGLCEMRCPDFAIWMNRDDDMAHPVEVEARRRLAL